MGLIPEAIGSGGQWELELLQTIKDTGHLN